MFGRTDAKDGKDVESAGGWGVMGIAIVGVQIDNSIMDGQKWRDTLIPT